MCADWKARNALEGRVFTDWCSFSNQICTPEGRLKRLNMVNMNLQCPFPSADMAVFSELTTLHIHGNPGLTVRARGRLLPVLLAWGLCHTHTASMHELSVINLSLLAWSALVAVSSMLGLWSCPARDHHPDLMPGDRCRDWQGLAVLHTGCLRQSHTACAVIRVRHHLWALHCCRGRRWMSSTCWRPFLAYMPSALAQKSLGLWSPARAQPMGACAACCATASPGSALTARALKGGCLRACSRSPMASLG